MLRHAELFLNDALWALIEFRVKKKTLFFKIYNIAWGYKIFNKKIPWVWGKRKRQKVHLSHFLPFRLPYSALTTSYCVNPKSLSLKSGTRMTWQPYAQVQIQPRTLNYTLHWGKEGSVTCITMTCIIPSKTDLLSMYCCSRRFEVKNACQHGMLMMANVPFWCI